jgi:hypothetical protein
MTPAPSSAQVAVGVTVAFGPPDLPVYDQPVCPGEDYIWAPGYWAWDADSEDYYWVPGTWVLAPEVGFFWTPGFWAWGGNGFVFTAGFWGPVVGWYGGINYGFGYFGHGYEGGRWQGGHFFYNTAVNNVNVTVIHNTYRTEINNVNVTRVSYNGGNGGIDARPTPQEEAASRERHIPPVAAQTSHEQAARSNRELHASVNHGLPAVAATPKPGDFKSRGVVRATEAGTVHGPNARAGNNGSAANPAIHPKELPPVERGPAPNTGNPKLDQKYQKQQEKLAAQQEKERQKLQQQQDKEHQQMAKQHADQAANQRLEQKHQQQTQQLQQKHAQQTQELRARQQPRPEAHPPAHAEPPPRS